MPSLIFILTQHQCLLEISKAGWYGSSGWLRGVPFGQKHTVRIRYEAAGPRNGPVDF